MAIIEEGKHRIEPGSAVQSNVRDKSSGFSVGPFVKGGLVPFLQEVSVLN